MSPSHQLAAECDGRPFPLDWESWGGGWEAVLVPLVGKKAATSRTLLAGTCRCSGVGDHSPTVARLSETRDPWCQYRVVSYSLPVTGMAHVQGLGGHFLTAARLSFARKLLSSCIAFLLCQEKGTSVSLLCGHCLCSF